MYVFLPIFIDVKSNITAAFKNLTTISPPDHIQPQQPNPQTKNLAVIHDSRVSPSLLPIHQEILSVLPSQYVQNLPISRTSTATTPV